MSVGSHTDIRPDHWTLRLLPAALKPYGRLARWDRPIGVWLLLFPGWWSVALASPLQSAADVRGLAIMLALFALGAIAMRGAGCTWNDILDRNIDAAVERTRKRPLPAGEVTVRQAAVWMALQALVGAAVLLSFNAFAIGVGLASLLLVAIYPLMKRVTSWPQAVLGLAFNWGALLGWAAARGELSPAALALYAGGVAWTLVYDTIYAMQDQRDDTVIGVRSTARRFQQAPERWLTLFAALTVACFGLAGWFAGAGGMYWLAVITVAAHLFRQIATLQPHDAPDCLAKFRANRAIGWLMFAGILLDRVV
jgi:4-hydroxybenzoate polyprenyltransferase